MKYRKELKTSLKCFMFKVTDTEKISMPSISMYLHFRSLITQNIQIDIPCQY